MRRVLYRLPEILVALKEGGTIVLAEGEKDVAALVKHGFAATCNAGGAGKWLDDYTATLRGAEVVIVADKDDAGRSHAQLVAGKLNGSAKSVRVVELPDFNAQPVKDAHDFFAVGATADDFRAILTAAPSVAAPTDSERLDPKPDLRTAPPKIASKSVITLSEEPDEPERASFPMDCLPATLVGLASGVARTARVPERLTGVCALGLVSAAIGAGLEVQSDPQRTTRGNLFLLVSAETGTGKSRTFELLAAPLLDHQEKLQERWRKESAPRIQSNFKILERELANLEKKAARATDPSERERLRAEHEYKTAEKNQLATCNIQPLLLVQDATTERLTAMMEEHGEVLFSASSDSRRDHVSSGSQEHIALILLRGGQFSPLLPAVGGSHCFSRMVPTFRAPPLTVGRRAFSGHPCGTLKHFETVSGAKIEVGGRTVQLPKTRPHGESDSAGIPEPLRSFSPVIVAPAPFLISPRSKRNEHPRDSAC